MNKCKVDLLKQKYQLYRTKNPRAFFFGRWTVLTLISVAAVSIIFSYNIQSTSDDTNSFPGFYFISHIKQLVQSGDRQLKGAEEDRVNVLLLGIGGDGHDGPQLTDTIVFASYKPTTQEIGLMSLPRDMTVPIPDYGYRKLNHANAYGEMDKPGSGPVLASQVISQILQQPVPYYVRVDFDGFAKLVDNLDGIDVYVDRSFTDETYPVHGKEYIDCEIPTATVEQIDETIESISTVEIVEEKQVVDYSCRFESLHFQEGWTRMDGETALKFARSRHGNNGEASDFARARRQQKLLVAIKDKIFSSSTLLNPAKIRRVMETLESHIATNLSVFELMAFAKEFKKIETLHIAHHVIDAGETSPLYATTLNGAYVLLPKNDDWTPLQQMAEQVFVRPDETAAHMTQTVKQKPTFVRVEIQNGTHITGLAFRTSQQLDGLGYEVVKIGNAETRDYKHTVIYDLTNGQRNEELKALQTFLQADVNLSATGWMMSKDVIPEKISVSSESYQPLTTTEPIDFLVILGQNAEYVATR